MDEMLWMYRKREINDFSESEKEKDEIENDNDFRRITIKKSNHIYRVYIQLQL